MARKGGLGKGLDSLIPETIKTSQPEKERIVEKVVEKIVEKPVELKVKISKVGPNKEQPRKQFVGFDSSVWYYTAADCSGEEWIL